MGGDAVCSSGEVFGLVVKRDPRRPVPPSTLWAPAGNLAAPPELHQAPPIHGGAGSSPRSRTWPRSIIHWVHCEPFCRHFLGRAGILSHHCGHQNHRSGTFCLRVARLPP